ncbi:E3 ubiquitin-protein ligase tom1 [Lithohypha guttulata]|nr:E3 ubiquitin-protein ligase tom1 [Lithohypha guttulata]
MGKVQKKANDKHKLSLSPALAEFIEKTTTLPLVQLPKHLASFPAQWPFPRGDLYNWIEALDRFDEVLRKINEVYGLSAGPQAKPFDNTVLVEGSSNPDVVELEELGLAEDGDQVLLQAILAFSRLLLEKCGNRTLYNSTDRLNDLLNTTSLTTLHETLRLTLVLAQRFADRGPQSPSHTSFYHFDLDKLQKLATPVPRVPARRGPLSPVKTPKSKEKTAQAKLRRTPTTADPNDFRALARPSSANTAHAQSPSDDSTEGGDWASVAALRIVWSPPTVSTSSTRPAAFRTTTSDSPSTPSPLRRHQAVGTAGPPKDNGPTRAIPSDQSDLRQIDLEASDLMNTTAEALLQKESETMPTTTRYEFLHKLRVAYGLLGSGETRNLLLCIRLAALGVVSQVYSEEEFTSKYFDGDSNVALRQQLVQQLVELLRDPKKGSGPSLYVQSLAMETLAILSRYRQTSTEIMSSLAPNSSHGLLLSLVQKGLANIAIDDEALGDSAGDEWRHAVFMLWAIFVTQTGPHNTRSTEQFVHKNLIVAYASGLHITTSRALRIHASILKFLEHIFHHFKDGLQVLNSYGVFTIACDTTEKLSKEALELYENGEGISEQWKTPGVDYKIPYQQQYVLRELIMLVKDISKHQGNHADRALRGFVDSASLLNAFRLILSHMAEFGSHTWSEVVTAICSFLNNEPTSYTIVSEAGIISTLLSTVQPQQSMQEESTESAPRTISTVPSEPNLGLPPIADAILNLATSFGAICLTETGHRQFVASNVLGKFFELFESPAHVKAIRDSNVLVQLGSTFDELVRHHPALKDLVVSSVVTMLARVRYICKTKFRLIGAGPKIWVQDDSGIVVDGGVQALMADDMPLDENSASQFAPLLLPTKDTLDFALPRQTPKSDLARIANDEDADGLTALDFARPVISFLAAFFDTNFLCKETLNAGATDLILDFVTLSTLPVKEDAFSDGLLIQDLTTLVRQIADEKSHLVLPLLADRARHICMDALTDFIDYCPSDMQCYFGQHLEISAPNSGMDVDIAVPPVTQKVNGTTLVRGLMSIYCISRVIGEVFTPPSYATRAHHNSVLTQINVADILSEVILLFGKLSAACCREEISLLALMPKTWLDATKPGNYSTGDHDVDTILDVSNSRQAEQDGSTKPSLPDNLKDVEETAAFRNLKTLRYLLTETPAAISTMFSRIGSSCSGRKKPETIIKQKLYAVGEAIAQALTCQLKPPFMSHFSRGSDDDRIKDWRFKYFTVVLSRLRDSLWEDNNNVPPNSITQSFIVDCFGRAEGLRNLDAIGTAFYEELKLCQVDKAVVFAANAGLKICLELLEDLTRHDLIQSTQTGYMKNTDRERPFYFNPNQLLLELRMESMPLTRRIWDSEYAEQASPDVIRRLAAILKHTLQGDNEENVVIRAEDFPTPKPHEKRKYDLDKTKINILREKGFAQDVAEEALYRCNVAHAPQMLNAEEYCKALNDNPGRRRLPIPANEVKHKGSANETPVSRVTSPPTAMDIISGPTTTVLEDSSQDEDLVDVSDMNLSNGISNTAINPPVDGSSRSNARSMGTTSSAMDLSVMLNQPRPAGVTAPRFSKQTIDAERESIREQLAERCNNILSSHPNLIFELNDLLVAGAAKLHEEAARSWWETVTDLLMSSLLSQNIDGDVDDNHGKKIAATAHLIGLFSNNDNFKSSTLKVMQDSIDGLVEFLRISGQSAGDSKSYPWIGPILLIVERMLAVDASPDEITWTPPNDVDSYNEPKLTHITVVDTSSKEFIFNQLMEEVLPKVGKDSSMAFAVVRVLVILTRDRKLAQLQGQRRNLQKLFLMVKQLSGRWIMRLQGALMTVLRHVIEDDGTIKQIMGTEITSYFKNRSTGRQPDLSNYLRDLAHLALRSPTLFVEVTNKKVKLLSWTSGQPGASSTLGLRDEKAEDKPSTELAAGAEANTAGDPTVSIETNAPAATDDDKLQDFRIPVVEHPDGVVHFILTELLAYKDVDDQESSPQGTKDTDTSSALNVEVKDGQSASGAPKTTTDKSEKPRFKADEHPIFMYRCYLLHCLTELLYSYNQTKVEFISFSRRADPLAATPSKARSGVLNYLLTSLVSSGYVDKDESIACRKRLVTSEWAMRVIVGLCAKTGEKGSGSAGGSRYPTQPRQIDDSGTEADLAYVRRFVLDHALKTFRDTTSASDSTQARYGRLLCLGELFNKLITKPSGQDGSVLSNNTSYKRIARMMLEKNFIAILTSAVSDIDLSFPNAKKVIKFILRPLKELTATAMDINLNHPDEFPRIIDQTTTDVLSEASSEVSDVDDDREETPDLYRNSALGMLDPARQDESDSDNEEEDGEEMDYDDYDAEMDYDEMAPPNDGEVISDEELEETLDGPGNMEGLPGDVPMDIEFVVDRHRHHHHHRHNPDDDESESSSDDEAESDGEDDAEDIEIEMEDDEIEHEDSEGIENEGGEDDWEDEEEGQEDEEDEDHDDGHFDEDELPIIGAGGRNPAAHLTDLLRELNDADLDDSDLIRDTNVILQTNDPDDDDDNDEEDDPDEDGDEVDDNGGMEYDQPFDMMLDGPDYDENDEWGWEEPPPPVFRRARHNRAGGLPSFLSRGVINMSDHAMEHHLLGSRHHRHAPSSRNVAEDGTNPLLQRPDVLGGDYDSQPPSSRAFTFGMQGRGGGAEVPQFMVAGTEGAPAIVTMGGNMGLGGLGGHGAILDAIMGAIQRGDQDFLQNGRIQFNLNPPSLRELMRPPPMPSAFLNRQPREDPQRSAQFIPMSTITRWQQEIQLVFGKNAVTTIQPIQTHIFAVLVPLAQQEEKERRRKAEEERQAEAEREVQRKAEEERIRKEDEVRLAREKAEAEEKERAEAEARATENVDNEQGDDVMEDVQAEEPSNQAAQVPDQPTRRYTTIRGRQLDITGLDIDVEYLEALPEDLREEVITAQYQVRREQAHEQGNDDSAIDQEFLDALPEDIREEIRAQEVATQRRRERERLRREAQAVVGGIQPGDMEPDDFLATLEPALRRAILAEQPPEILNALNPQHAAEGRAHARSMFYQRMPMNHELETARARREQDQRDSKRQQIVQLVDKAGVATLLRLMFIQQQGSLKSNLLHILSQVCGNRQTRYEVISLLLVILKEGSTDVTAIEKSLASLSLRARASGSQKTPQPLKRTLSSQPYSSLSEDVTPIMVVQQCLHVLSYICRQNPHVKSLFLREVDVTSTSKGKNKTKGKLKEVKNTTHPVNDLISLLDRQLIMDNSSCLHYLAALLAVITSPLASLMKQEKERQQAGKVQKEELSKDETSGNEDKTAEAKGDVAMEDAPQATESLPEASNKDKSEVSDQSKALEQEKKRPFEPPNVTEHNLKLITNIFVAPECGNDTFRCTLETLQSLAHIPGTSEKFGKELTGHVHSLSEAICGELDELLPAIEDAQSSMDVQGAAAAKFSASTSDQVKLLRVLQALDYLSAPKKEDDTASDQPSKSVLTLSYEHLGLSPLWSKLSECLTAVEEKGDTISFANILLPLIESLMVVCKHTTLKDTPVQVKEVVVTSPIAPTYQDELEELFFKFTSDHRKILNDIVRQSPKLMQGHFSILIKNSKVLDFDNKRNYFNKQIHSRHHAQRHPQPPLQLNVRREQVFIDSYKALYFKSADEMKYGKLNIRFNGEEGVDAGGVTREWFQVLARGMFDPNYALFQPVASDKTTFHPSPLSRVNPEHLLYFKFIGRIIGKALHEGRVLDCHFSRAVYKRILGKKPNLKDLESNDVDYYKSLVWILENDITDILTEEFCVIEDEFGEEKVIDLIPNGRNIAVTEENKKEYVQALVEYRLTESVKEQLDSFLGGFHDIIPAELIAVFNEQELELLISGLPEVDVDDWKANTEYHNYSPSSQQIVWFWRIVKAMSNEERAKLLQFITGTSKVPLNGFKELEGVSGLTKCNIHKDPSTNRLPTSHTCFNQLDLPAYESFEVMKHNISTAISLGADYFGFA